MAREHIARISIRNEEVYLYSRNAQRFREFKSEELSKTYQEYGFEGLDRAMIRHFLFDSTLVGDHPSVLRYKRALESAPVNNMIAEYRQKRDSFGKELARLVNNNLFDSLELHLAMSREYERKIRVDLTNFTFDILKQMEKFGELDMAA